MRADAMMWGMDTRKIAGDIVREELARQGGLTYAEAARRAGLAKSTFVRVIQGDATVQEITLRQVEGLLGLPRRFLTYVIAADVETLNQLDSLDPDLRRLAVASLSDVGETVEGAGG